MDSSLPATLQALERLAGLLADAGTAPRAPRVLELGPGRTPELLAAMILMGAERGIGIDVDIQVPADAENASRYESLAHALCAPERSTLLERFGVTARAVHERFESLRSASFPLEFRVFDGMNLPLEEGEIDLIVSKSVLEHVRHAQVDPLLCDMRRVLAADGAMVHMVDLRDHLHIDGDDRVLGDWLEALQLSSRRFELMFSRRSTCINRLRGCEWRDALRRSELTIVTWYERRFPLVAGFDPRALQPPWSGYSVAELAIGQVDFVARRSSSGD
jgi:SAM-dependent methyltransferase